jgi:serine phosphatase RsbU (regulator of sigma subunit)/TPR repeat protein
MVWNDSSQADTIRLKTMYKIIWDGYLFSQPDSAFYFAKIQYDFAESVKNKKWIGNATNTQGASFYVRGQYDQAIDYFKKTLRLGDKDGIAAANNNIGLIHNYRGNYKEAIFFFKKSLEIREETDNKKGIATSLINIGIIYKNLKNLDEALDYYKNGLAVFQELNDKKGIAASLNNIGIISAEQGRYDESLIYTEKSLIVFKELGDKKGIASSLNDIGNIYSNQNDHDAALAFFKDGLKLFEELGDQNGITMSLGDIGDAYFIQKDYQKAILNFEKAFYIAEEIGALDQINRVSESLHKLYKTQKKWNKALHMHELFLESKDSLSNMDAKEELYRFEIEKEFELEKLADSLLFMQQMEVKSEQIKTQNEKIKREKSITYSLFLGMLIVSASLIIIFKNLKKTKKQKGIIEDQKAIVESANDELEEKNKEIMDSINYAKRIQSAILPPIKTVKKHFEESFILYKPKDIVAGDFYWMEKKNEKILFAAADCTGHGVPGAMVSVVCNNGLNRSVREHDLTVPGEILDKTREIIIEEFQKSEEDVKDGMDIALCSVTGMKLQYAGAYNPLWIIRNGEIIERKADKQPIGQFENTKPYTTHSFDLEKGDTIYIFSDGYVDQFGGERGKKFKGKAFRELLLSIQEKNMEDQKTIINKTFETWKGELEQIDDICIIGVRV